jgi:mRNA interferase RelE/StbE
VAYKIIYSKSAAKDIRKLDSVTKKKLGRAIERYSQNPQGHAKKLISSKIGQYRWRAGSYRIVFDLSGKTIQVLRLGHRREIYKK